ncbi:MAG: hypothetical protein LUG52_07300 [Clostridia bacterium]|nr:hypothetical protein [Clostridia bacterium]
MYKMSDEVRAALEKSIGIDLGTLNKMSIDEQKQWVENKTGKKLVFRKDRKKYIIGRGNPLLSRRKIRTMEDVDRRSKQLFGI